MKKQIEPAAMKYVLAILVTILPIALFAQGNPAAKVIEIIAAEEQLNGVILVAQNGKVTYQDVYGKADLDKRTPMKLDTKFLVGSITKQFTAVLVMQEVEAKTIDLDKFITDYLPDFRKDTGSKITIRHLLTHTHGIPNIEFTDRTKPISRKNFVKNYCEVNLAFEPGTKFEYSNIAGYYILGMILEKVTAKTYDKLLEERITIPLLMKNTGYFTARNAVKDLAFGHHIQTGVPPTKLPEWHTTYAFSAAGIYSTAADLFTWDRALRSTKLLSAESLKVIFTSYNDQVPYGFGWYINDPEINGAKHIFAGHTGGANGFMSQVMRGVSDDVLVIYLSNIDKFIDIRTQVIEALVQ